MMKTGILFMLYKNKEVVNLLSSLLWYDLCSFSLPYILYSHFRNQCPETEIYCGNVKDILT